MFQFAKLLALSLMALGAVLFHSYLSSGASVPTVMQPVSVAALHLTGAVIASRDRLVRPCAISRERDQATDCQGNR